MRWGSPVVVALAIASVAPSTAVARPADKRLANRCVSLATPAGRVVTASPDGDGYQATKASRRKAMPLYIKPTGLGTQLVYDAQARLMTIGAGSAVLRGQTPGPSAEWSIVRARRGRYVVRSTATGGALGVDDKGRLVTLPGGLVKRFEIARKHGCRTYPEAELDATGKAAPGQRRSGSLIGFADAHLHITADMRAGGQVIYGESFDPFGITEALGRDADVHGPDGSLDITGNLLRSGSPAGTHDTSGWPMFNGWPTPDTYTHQQIYYRWLQRAWLGGLRLVVAQTVEDQPLCNIEPRRSHDCDETTTIELEVKRLRALQDYVDAQSGGRGRGWFRLVYDPGAAWRVIAGGKLAVVIGVESSDPFGCSEFQGQPQCDKAGIDRGIQRMRAIGVRGMFLAHWVDNALAGAALEGGAKGTFISGMEVAQTGHPFQVGACPDPLQGEELVPGSGKVCNTKGLTALGEYAVQQMIANRMLIEVDHLSERARDQVLAIAERAGYPLVSSHTGTGGTWTPAELRRLFAGGGFATAHLDDAATLAGRVQELRTNSSERFPRIGFGTDTGGFNELPGPAESDGRRVLEYPFRSYLGRIVFNRQRTGQRTYDINTDGVAHYGLLPDILAVVQRQIRGREALAVLSRSADAYVRTWRLATTR